MIRAYANSSFICTDSNTKTSLTANISFICTDSETKTGKTIYDLADDGLTYLDTRTDFWRQQKPMYARRYERYYSRKKYASKKAVSDIYIIGELEKIDEGKTV